MGSIWDPTFCENANVAIGDTCGPSRTGGGTMVTGERLRSSEVATGERLRRRHRRRDYESNSWNQVRTPCWLRTFGELYYTILYYTILILILILYYTILYYLSLIHI